MKGWGTGAGTSHAAVFPSQRQRLQASYTAEAELTSVPSPLPTSLASSKAAAAAVWSMRSASRRPTCTQRDQSF